MTSRLSTVRPSGNRRWAIDIGMAALIALASTSAQAQGAMDSGEVRFSGAFNFTMKVASYSLIAFQGNPLQHDPSQPCMFKVDLWGTGHEYNQDGLIEGDGVRAHLSFTGLLTKGLGKSEGVVEGIPIPLHKDRSQFRGSFRRVGAASLFPEPWTDESANPDTFFVRLGLPPDFARRTGPGVQPVGSEFFRSAGGGMFQVVRYTVDQDVLMLRFDFLKMLESVGAQYGPRELSIEGRVDLPLNQTEGSALSALAAGLRGAGGSSVQASSYMCSDPE